MIPYGRQQIDQADIDAVVAVLRSDFLTQGPKVPEFENVVADYCAARHAVAVNSGTSALHIACLALDLGPGDLLWTSPITFVASANCALYCGAGVDFVDIDPKTCNLCPKALEEKLCEAQKTGRLPKVVVPVHLSGQPCDMAAIHALSRKYGFRIIEDASHAIGGKYKNEPIGNCRYCDITVFSFHPVKLITTGEGGIATTNDPALAKKMDLLRSHGITRDPAQMTHAPDGPWYYQQIALGFNYRMTDIQAALGISQMSRLDEFVTRRHELAQRYDRLLVDLPVILPHQHPDGSSAWHLYVLRIKPGTSPENTTQNAGGQSLIQNLSLNSSQTHEQIFEYLREKQIGVNLHYIPVHLQPWYTRMGFAAGMFPDAEKYYQEAITLPLFPAMTEEQQDKVINTIKQALKIKR